MPRTIEIGFLEEGAAAASAEIIRRALQPAGRSLPHVTLRHTARDPGTLWDRSDRASGRVHLTLDGVTTFDDDADGEQVRTVILRCSSEDLDLRSYKPDFPVSVPHVTLYEGAPSRLAARALRLLTTLAWHRAIDLSLHIFASSREALQHSTAQPHAGVLLTSPARTLLTRLYAELNLHPTTRMDALSDAERLSIVELAARTLLNETHPLPPHRSPPEPAPGGESPAGQLAFWTPEEVWAITGTGPHSPRARAQVNSAFATPPDLALDVAYAVADLAAEDESFDFGDPAAGNGVLLAAARKALGVSRVRSARVVELDATAARLFRNRWSHTNTTTVEGDFLQISPEPATWNLVIANPPYRRSQLVAKELSSLRDDLAKRLDLRISARSDLYVYFLLRSHAWMKEGGIAAWIIPAEYQVTRYGASIRRYLTSHAEVLRIHTYDATSPVFDNALTSTSVVIFRKRRALPNNLVTISQGGTLRAADETLTRNIVFLRSAERWNFAALDEMPSQERALVVGDLFEVRRGIATGSNPHFVLSTPQLSALSVSRRWVRPLLPRVRELANGTIGRSADGSPVPSSHRWLIDTDEDLETIEAESPLFGAYLRRIEREVGERALVSRRSPFWKQELRDPPPFIFASMAKVDSTLPRFIRNRSDGVFLNNYLGLYPRADIATEAVATESYFNELHQMLLKVSQLELTRQGRVYGKGLLKLEPGDLKSVRLPL